MTGVTVWTRRSSGHWAGVRRPSSYTDWTRQSGGIATTNGGGGPSRSTIPRSAPTTRRSTATDRERRPARVPRRSSRPDPTPADMPGPVLVTGAAGFAGGHLLDRLSRQSIPVVAWQRPGGAPSDRADRSPSRVGVRSTGRPSLPQRIRRVHAANRLAPAGADLVGAHPSPPCARSASSRTHDFRRAFPCPTRNSGCPCRW